jgi:cell division protein FtsB
MTSEKIQRPERKRTGQLSGIQIMFAAILAIGLILGLNFTNLVTTGQPLQQLYNQVTDEITKLQEEQGNLTRERDYVRSDAFVENWARSEGKMVKPGEVLVIPVPSVALAEATPEPTPPIPFETTTPQLENWQLWWQMFFDSPPPQF